MGKWRKSILETASFSPRNGSFQRNAGHFAKISIGFFSENRLILRRVSLDPSKSFKRNSEEFRTTLFDPLIGPVFQGVEGVEKGSCCPCW